MRRRLRYCVFLLALFLCAGAGAQESIVVESKTVLRAEAGVTVGVFIKNEIDWWALVIPLEFREIDSGAYLTRSFDLTEQARVTGSGLLNFLTVHFASEPEAVNWCSGPISQTYTNDDRPIPFLPRAVLWSGLVTVGSPYRPGSDGTPDSGTPSLLFTFDVTAIPGIIEIDTCCFAPANHLGASSIFTGWFPSPFFTKGVITISDSCACAPHLAALAWEGEDVNVGHVTEIVDVAFREYEPVSERCPWIYTDVNCDGVTDVLDAVRMINIVFRGDSPLTQVCNPCEAGQ